MLLIVEMVLFATGVASSYASSFELFMAIRFIGAVFSETAFIGGYVYGELLHEFYTL